MIEQKGNGSKLIRVLEVSAIVFSVITGAMSVSVIIWKGGSMAQMLTAHEVRLMKIESAGSPTLDTHIKVDDERERNLKERMTKLEDIFKVALDMRSEMSRLSQQLTDLKEAMNKKP